MLAELSGDKVDAETMLTYAEEIVPANENSAFTYKRRYNKIDSHRQEIRRCENDTEVRNPPV